MESNSEGPGANAVIRLGRAGRLSWGVALAVSLALGLNAFVLVSGVRNYVDAPLSIAYVAFLVLFFPVVLTYAERAMAVRGRRGSDIFSLLRAGGSDLRAFAGGWLLLMGYLGLAALLSLGLGLYLSVLAQSWFGLAFDVRHLILLSLLLAALPPLLRVSSIGSLRATLVYAGLVVVSIIAGWVWINPMDAAPVVEKQPMILWGVVALLAPTLWGIDLLLDYRKQMRQPRRAWLPALLIPFVLGGLVGAAASAVEGYPYVWIESLEAPARLTAHLEPAFLEVVFLLAGLLANFVALSGVLARYLRLIEAMAEHGFLPRGSSATEAWLQPLLAWVLVVLAVALVVVLIPLAITVGWASLGFLWVTALLNAPDVLRTRGRPSRGLGFRLPFHPLFPGLAAVVGVLLSLALPLVLLLAGAAWMLTGGVYYLIYARRRAIAVREARSALREAEPPSSEGDYCVMAAITDPYMAVSLIQAGARLAKAQKGHLIVLQVLTLSEQLPEKMRRYGAQEQLQTLEGYVQRAGIGEDLSIIPFVRVSPDVAPGIIDTAREEGADLLLLAWEETRQQQMLDRVWKRVSGEGALVPAEEPEQEASELTPLLDGIVRRVGCDVVIIRGQLPQKIERLLVPISGRPQISPALKLGRALAAEDEGELAILRVVPAGTPAPTTSFLPSLDDVDGVEERIVQADSVESAILKEAHLHDVLLMSAAEPSLLAESFFGSIPVKVTRARRQPTLLVRPSQRAYQLGLRRAWDWLTGAFSALTPAERAGISAQMRDAARPSINFFVLITLAAAIATLGLLQSSAAVIIGAMLVAPLMSPIASMAMGIVEGDAHLMRVAAEAILKGVAVAVSVGIAITLIAPDPQTLTEISARIQPNLLDLVVALASGAAAGYALSHREVGAALPGVAIAVALVPPLCVVGYGIATAQLEIAGGAFLLFSTNVIAIILAAVTVFLLLGFRPMPAQQEHFRRGLVVSLLSLALIAIPLAFLLDVSLDRAEERRHQAEVEALLREAIPADTAHVVDVVLEERGGVYDIRVTVHAFGDFGSKEIARLEDMLSAELASPVTLQAVVLDARLTGSGGDLPVAPSPSD